MHVYISYLSRSFYMEMILPGRFSSRHGKAGSQFAQPGSVSPLPGRYYADFANCSRWNRPVPANVRSRLPYKLFLNPCWKTSRPASHINRPLYGFFEPQKEIEAATFWTTARRNHWEGRTKATMCTDSYVRCTYLYNNVTSVCIFIGCWPWSIKGHTQMASIKFTSVHVSRLVFFHAPPKKIPMCV